MVVLALGLFSSQAEAQRCSQGDGGFSCSPAETFDLRHTLAGRSGTHDYSFPIRVRAELSFDSFMGDVISVVRYEWVPDGAFVIDGHSFDFNALPASTREELRFCIDIRGFLRGSRGDTRTPPIGRMAVARPARTSIRYTRHQDPDDAIEGHSEESARSYFREGFVVERLEVVGGDAMGVIELAEAVASQQPSGVTDDSQGSAASGVNRVNITDSEGNITVVETADVPSVTLHGRVNPVQSPTPQNDLIEDLITDPVNERPAGGVPRGQTPSTLSRAQRDQDAAIEAAKRLAEESARREQEADRTSDAIAASVGVVTSMPVRDLHSGEFRFLLGIGSITGVHSLDNGASGASTGGLLFLHGNILGPSGFGFDGELTVGAGFSLDSADLVLGTRALVGTRYNNWVAARVGLDVAIAAAELEDGSQHSRRTLTFPMGIALTPAFQNDLLFEVAAYWQAGGFAVSGELAIESFLFRYDYRSYRTHSVHWMSIAYRPV